ncbi:MAG TPA: LLM class flavin-dependent oxidoreductase [Microthrixaceae bacterium]|nr:LLM class flavin-dependent oxidoreductase [Microthrixaceae bacterium]
MTRLEIRYDLRNPAEAGVAAADRYDAALEQIEWAEKRGFKAVTLSEHHGTVDSYLPSPIVFGAAVAARTTGITIRIAALIASMHDPLRVAEDLAVLDQLSRGRVELVVANGYVEAEFAMFDKELSGRVAAVTEMIATLKSAWTGEPFEFRGRQVRVTPRPFRDPRPAIYLGGSSRGAARRAARISDAFFPSDSTYWRDFCQAIVDGGGPDYGEFPPVGPRFVHISNNVDDGWEEVGESVARDRNAYGAWAADAGVDTGHRSVSAGEVEGTDDLRNDPEYVVQTPEQCIEMIRELGPSGTLPLNPMMGGIPPEVAWRSLRLFESEVMPYI